MAKLIVNQTWIAEILATLKEYRIAKSQLAHEADMEYSSLIMKLGGKIGTSEKHQLLLSEALGRLRDGIHLAPIPSRSVSAYTAHADPEKLKKTRKAERLTEKWIKIGNETHNRPCDKDYINTVKVEYVTYPGRN